MDGRQSLARRRDFKEIGANVTDFDLRINPELRPDELALAYQKNDMVRIDNIFPSDVAEAIYTVLAKHTPWHMVHANAQGEHKYYRPEEWRALGAEQQRAIHQQVQQQARDGFSYLYYCYPMIDALVDGLDPEWPLHALTEYLNSDEMRDFVKAVTNEPSVLKLDAQASLYAPGHFLNTHNDRGGHAERRAAYVLSFCKDWRADWGGELLFLDDDDNVETGFTPNFNSLTMFKVPRTHIVTQVASFAGSPRLSVVGWLRDDPK